MAYIPYQIISASKASSDTFFYDSQTTCAPANSIKEPCAGRYYWKPNENAVGCTEPLPGSSAFFSYNYLMMMIIIIIINNKSILLFANIFRYVFTYISLM